MAVPSGFTHSNNGAGIGKSAQHCLCLFLEKNEPVRAFPCVRVKPLAIIASHALAGDDLRAADGSPFTGLLADLAGIALGPPLDPEDREVGKQTQKRTYRTKKTAIQIPHENRRNKQNSQSNPHSRRRLP